jgi:hypothetical protein
MVAEIPASDSPDDPLLYDFPMPLTGEYYPLGFPLSIATNSECVLAAAKESWEMFSERFDTRAISLRVGVRGGDKGLPPQPTFRAQGNLLSFIGDAENFSIGDMSTGFGFCWLSPAVAQNRALARYHYLDSLTLSLIDARYVCTLHAACVELDGRGVLLCGASFSGKSTLAYACARRGWGYVTDDAARILRETGRRDAGGRQGRIVIGNPHLLRLRPDAGRFFPEFQDRLATERVNGKMSIEIATAKESQIRRMPECEIHHIVFLERAEGARANLFLCRRERALAEMAMTMPFGTPEERAARLSYYRHLLEAPLMRMEYSDLDDAVDCLENLVRRQRDF